MRVRDNTVVTFSYYFLSSPEEDSKPEPSKIHKMEVLIGRDMLPRNIEIAVIGMEEGAETTLPIKLSPSSPPDQAIEFFPFSSLPEGIEPKKGMKVPVIQGNGSTEMILVDDVLPDGIIGKKITEADEEPRWIKIRIESVRWATLREFQEGRVISTTRHHHGHHYHVN
ncbi:MAG: hypothetical protein WHS38_01530 [Thermodesulforhabdaceae bacterium]